MKNSTLTLLLVLLFSIGYSQELFYEVRASYENPITKDKLISAKSVGDIKPGYPTNWMVDYVSVEVSSTCNGKAMKALSANDMLSAQQKNILQTMDLGADVVVDVQYKTRNAATEKMDLRKMNFTVTRIPEIEAKYSTGEEQMSQYLKKNVISKIPVKNSNDFPGAAVKFTIDEQGAIANAKISLASADPKIDKMLLDAINKMPKWIPAQNATGTKVKQEFVFSVGNGGC